MDAVMTEAAAVITTVVFGLFSFSSSAVDAEQIHLAETAADAANVSCYEMCKCHVLRTHVKRDAYRHPFLSGCSVICFCYTICSCIKRLVSTYIFMNLSSGGNGK